MHIPRPVTSASESHVEPQVLPAFPRRSRLAMAALVLALLPVMSWAGCVTRVLDPENEGAVVWLLSVALAFLGAILGFVNARRLRHLPRDDRPAFDRPLGQRMSVVAGIVGLFSPVLTFFAGIPFIQITRGRRLVRDGVSRLPATTVNAGWLRDDDDRSAHALLLDAPPAAADAWRENAATEHASVAAFAHLSTQLLALGAPADLVEAAHEDALDEVRHARLCYGIAAAIDGNSIGPAPFPWAVRPAEQAPTYAQLAADALLEACLLEGASARLIASLAAVDDVEPSVRETLRSIAADEGRHAAHGWQLITWAREQGGGEVDEALWRALERQPATIDAALDERWADGQLSRFGIPSSELWEHCYRMAYEHTARRLRRMTEAGQHSASRDDRSITPSTIA